jgi:hypothetical protein
MEGDGQCLGFDRRRKKKPTTQERTEKLPVLSPRLRHISSTNFRSSEPLLYSYEYYDLTVDDEDTNQLRHITIIENNF